MQHVDIGIVGGGIVGLTLAAALKESSLSVAIIDKHPLSTALGEKPNVRRMGSFAKRSRQCLRGHARLG